MSWYSTVAQYATTRGADRSPDLNRDWNEAEMGAPSAAVAQAPLLRKDPVDTSPRQRLLPSLRPRLLPTAADRIYTGFDVSQPVGTPEELSGRDKEVNCLLSGVLHRRNHGLVSGPRGSGKTSLVRVFGQFADAEGVVVLYSACDSGTSFGELLRGYLEQIPASSIDPEEVDVFDDRVLSFGADDTPHQATSILAMVKYSQVVIVLDEFDRITDPGMYRKISSLLKLVSDARIAVRFVLVGGNSAFADVVRGHPSLMRHMTLVCTAPLADKDVRAVLDRCAERSGLRFSEGAHAPIVEVACGSPYHARLFGMHAALKAVAAEQIEISADHALAGLSEAFEEWATLNQNDAATFRSICQDRDSERYIALARQYAIRTADEEFPIGQRASGNRGPEESHDPDVGPLGGMLDVRVGRASFFDATAPQFLIALHRTEMRGAASA